METACWFLDKLVGILIYKYPPGHKLLQGFQIRFSFPEPLGPFQCIACPLDQLLGTNTVLVCESSRDLSSSPRMKYFFVERNVIRTDLKTNFLRSAKALIHRQTLS